jgi:hypothetical protein
MARSRRKATGVPPRSRVGPPHPVRRYNTPEQVEKANRRTFYEVAWRQRVCQSCGKGGAYEAHHVVEKQKLKQEGRLDLKWDTRNCLRLCPGCHAAHTIGYRRVSLDMLTDDNYEFALFFLGRAASSYLRRHYNGKDRRWTELDRKCDELLEEEKRESAA